MGKTSGSLALAKRKTKARSSVTNGTDVLAGIDQRLAIARRYRDLIAAVLADCGGIERCSEAKVSLIRRFAAQCCMAEKLEAALVNNQPVDIAEHSLLASTLVRIAQRIGISRVPKNVMPTLAEYLEQTPVGASPEGV